MLPRVAFRCYDCGAPQPTTTDLVEIEDRSYSETHLYYLGRFSATLAFWIAIGVRIYLGIIVIVFIVPTVLIGGIAGSPSFLNMVPIRLQFLLVDMADEPVKFPGLFLHMMRAGVIGFVLWAMLSSVGKAAQHRFLTGTVAAIALYGGMALLFHDTHVLGPFAGIAGLIGIYLALAGTAALDFSHSVREEIRILYHEFLFSVEMGVARYLGNRDG